MSKDTDTEKNARGAWRMQSMSPGFEGETRPLRIELVLNVRVSGPVWEYFRATKNMKFEEAPQTMNRSLFKQQTLINDAVDGLLRELLLDQANGFIGKTIIHPTHIPYVNGMLAVTREVYDDALQVLGTSGGVVKSSSGNKMNEIGPHRCWVEKIIMRARAYGVIEDESRYAELFTAD